MNLDKAMLERIAPKAGAKYSPNLHKWLKRQLKRSVDLRVFRVRDALWIGFDDEGLFLIGSRLIGVLCSLEPMAAYPIKMHCNPVEIPDFWQQYERDGRCAIDRDHSMMFIGDESRWKIEGDSRECLWCGNCKQRRETYEVTTTNERWVTS